MLFFFFFFRPDVLCLIGHEARWIMLEDRGAEASPLMFRLRSRSGARDLVCTMGRGVLRFKWIFRAAGRGAARLSSEWWI